MLYGKSQVGKRNCKGEQVLIICGGYACWVTVTIIMEPFFFIPYRIHKIGFCYVKWCQDLDFDDNQVEIDVF